MGTTDKPKYFNFPVMLLNGLFEDKTKALTDILLFALYAHSLKMDADGLYSSSELSKFKSAVSFYNVNLGEDDKIIKNDLHDAKQLFNRIPIDTPKVGLNISIFWDYFYNEKSDFDIACLTAFLAIKSILGSKSYCKTTNSFLWARMSGNSKAIKDISELSEAVKKYANEYQTKRLKFALSENWGLVTYSRYTRGFFVSFTLSIEELVFEAEKRRKSTKAKQAKAREAEAVKMALSRLNDNS